MTLIIREKKCDDCDECFEGQFCPEKLYPKNGGCFPIKICKENNPIPFELECNPKTNTELDCDDVAFGESYIELTYTGVGGGDVVLPLVGVIESTGLTSAQINIDGTALAGIECGIANVDVFLVIDGEPCLTHTLCVDLQKKMKAQPCLDVDFNNITSTADSEIIPITLIKNCPDKGVGYAYQTVDGVDVDVTDQFVDNGDGTCSIDLVVPITWKTNQVQQDVCPHLYVQLDYDPDDKCDDLLCVELNGDECGEQHCYCLKKAPPSAQK